MADATKAVVDRTIAPVLEGTVVDSIPAWNLATQRRLHLVRAPTASRSSPSPASTSRSGTSRPSGPGCRCNRLLGSRSSPAPVPFYASLVRYADDAVAPRVCEGALEDGFKELKLHEITLPHVRACREAVGGDTPISVDVNCAWSEREARDAIAPLLGLNVSWLEEPTFPPERFGPLRRLRGHGLPVAAGENWCTLEQFSRALEAEAVDLAQPSVTKVGGISEFLRIHDVCLAAGVPVLPHCPYFGPGLHASLQLAAAVPGVRRLEWLYVQPDAWLAPLPKLGPGGTIKPPNQPGTGFEPDPEVLTRFRRA